SPTPQPFAGVHGRFKKRLAMLIGGTGREDDRRGASLQGFLRLGRPGGLVSLVEKGKPRKAGLRRAIPVGFGKAGWEETDHSLRRVHPLVKYSANGRQSQFRANDVDRWAKRRSMTNRSISQKRDRLYQCGAQRGMGSFGRTGGRYTLRKTE